MSAEDRDDKDPLQPLIAEVLEAENRGESVDRQKLMDQYPDHADSLREFFASHDRMKSAAEVDPPTLPPAADSSLEDPTIQPGSMDEDPTIVPAEPALSKPASPDNGPEVGDKVRYFGDYELLEEISRGGMGVVYKARQANLNRVVALKMILAGQFAGEEDVQRFYTEAEAAASLDHPGIVPIFEIGEHAGQHYFSMGYIEGQSLAQRVADGPLPPREAAELVKKICDAMAYAHERGVIHRDLKPANILIDANGQPKVTDFGLAKKTEADCGLTGTGQILGTPAYMPPEQASGKTDVGPLADVYSLGAILYCLLTGRPPFQAASPMDTLLQVLDQEPVAPRELNETVPRDLETICLKGLHKDATKRYPSSTAIAAELGRFLNSEPIQARPVGRIERSWRWCKRNPTTAFLSGAVAISLIAGTVVSCWLAVIAVDKSNVATHAQETAEEEKIAAQEQRSLAEEQRQIAEWRLYATQVASMQAQVQPFSRRWRSAVDVSYTSNKNKAPTGWEYQYLRSVETGIDQGFAQLSVAKWLSSDWKQIIVKKSNQLAEVWDAHGGEGCVTVTLSPRYGHDPIFPPNVRRNPRFVVGCGGESLAICNAVDGSLISLLGEESKNTSCLSFSPDGVWFVSGSKDGVMQFWDIRDGNRIKRIESKFAISAIAVSHNGELVAIGDSNSGEVSVFDIKSGKKTHTLEGAPNARVESIAFGPSGKKIVSTHRESPASFTRSRNWVVVWSLATEERLLEYQHDDGKVSATFSPDGNNVQSVRFASTNTLSVWSMESKSEILRRATRGIPVNHVDGLRVASPWVGKIEFVDPVDAIVNPIVKSAGPGHVKFLSFSADSLRLVSGTEDGTLIVWNSKDWSRELRRCKTINYWIGIDLPSTFRASCQHAGCKCSEMDS